MPNLTEIQAALRAEESALRTLCEDLRGRRLAAARYHGQTGTELDIWMRDHGDAHELDFGVELEFSGGALVHATWGERPSYHLRLRSGPLWPYA